jgi:TRAP-type transport system periplasmic protein
MKKIVLLLLGTLLIVALLVSGCATQSSVDPDGTGEETPVENQSKEGTIPLIFAMGGPFYPEFAESFFVTPYVEYLTGKTQFDPALDGKFDIKIYPNAQLYNQNDAQTALAEGSIHMTYGGPNFYEQWNPAWQLLMTSGVIDDWDHFLRVMETEPFKELEQDLASKGITILNWSGNAGDVFIFTSKQIQTLDELKGMKIRYFAGEGQAKALAALGAQPVFLPYTEVVTALQTNQIDGVVTDLTGGAFFFELYTYAPNMLPYMMSVQPICNAVNTSWYEALPSNTEPFNPGVRESFDRVFQGMRTDHYIKNLEEWAYGAWDAVGGYIAPYSVEEQTKFISLMQEVLEPIVANIDPKYMEAIDSVR